MRKEDNHEVKVKIAFTYSKNENYGEAEFWLGQVVHTESTPSEYWLYFFACLAQNQKCDLGLGYLCEFEKQNPNNKRLECLKQFLNSQNYGFTNFGWDKIIIE
ncbi:MAG: hypothetical protein ACI97N_002374 [Cognaticolwellia sp.]